VPKVMLDTNAFNHLLSGEIPASTLDPKWTLLATQLQFAEILKTRNPGKKAALERLFRQVLAERVPTESAVWDVSAWGEAKWGDGGPLYEELRREIEAASKSKPINSMVDALIGETCLKNGFALVTNDRALKEAVRARGGTVYDLRAGYR